MQTINHFLGVMLVLSIVVLPATPVFAETGQAGTAGELTLADFQRMYAGQKAIVAQSEYERYQYGLKHPSTGKVVEAVAYISPAYRLKPWLNGAPRKGKN